MNNLKKLTDSAILELCISGDSQAFQELVWRYFFKAKRLANTYRDSLEETGITLEDIQTVAFEALLIAYDKITTTDGASFYNFWKHIATTQIIKYIENNSLTRKAMMFKGVYSLDQYVRKDSVVKYEEVLGEEDVYIANLPDKLDQVELMVKFVASLSKSEKEVYDLLIQGLTREEMSETLKIPMKTVYACVRRIRKKYRQIVGK